MKKRIAGNPYVWLGLIVLAGSIVRLAALGQLPPGLHQDEAYSAYNSLSVMNYGIDSYGYTRPVYYTAWGSGMSVLYSYLTMPFFALFGVSAVTVRLPQAILGCISILAAFGCGKEFFHGESRLGKGLSAGEGRFSGGCVFGLLFAAFLAINPWHIQQSRFGLDANLAVPMLLFGIYFLCRYLKGKDIFIYPAAFFLGLTLYCYAVTWPLIPAILAVCLLLYRKKIRFNIHLAGGILLLFVMAVPLLLFLGVNFGWIPEIRTAVFSIPLLPEIRADEFSLGSLADGFKWMVAMLWEQHDDIWWITDERVGAYYFISAPFILFGIVYHIKELAGTLRRKEQIPVHYVMLVWLAVMFLVGCGIETAKYYKINCFHIPVIFYVAYGIGSLWSIIRAKKASLYLPAAAVTGTVYLGFFCYFLYSQLTFVVKYEEYGNPITSHMLWNQYEEAVDYAEGLTDGDISVIGLNYANLLLYKQMSPYEYMDTVVYEESDQAFRKVSSIGRYHFDALPEEDLKDGVYIFPYRLEADFREQDFMVEQVTQCYGVAYKDTINGN